MIEHEFFEEYAIWVERTVLSECLFDLNLKDMADKVLQSSLSSSIMSKYVNIIKKESIKQRNYQVFDKLHFSCLPYIKGV